MAKTSKYNKVIGMVTVGFAGLLGATVVQATEITRGSVIAATCYTCHGTDGASSKGMPSINGMSADHLKRVLLEFKEKKRPSTVMGRHASGYTDEELADVAKFLGNLKK